MLRSRHVALALVAMLMATLIPCSAMVYAQGSEGKRAENFVELAERAGEKVGNFIEIIYANDTAIDTIKGIPGLYDELEANKTLFETGEDKLDDAREALDAGDFSGAIANATEALSIFRDVFKALNTILAEAGVERGQLIDAQGLIEAMKRALDRIKRIEDMEPSEEVLEMLESSKEYLDVDMAILWLREGRVNETAWNLTQANKLISRAHVSLRKNVVELNVKRVGSYLEVIDKFYERLSNLVEHIVKDPDLKAQLESELAEAHELIEAAKGAEDFDVKMSNLMEARSLLESIQRAIVESRKGGTKGS